MINLSSIKSFLNLGYNSLIGSVFFDSINGDSYSIQGTNTVPNIDPSFGLNLQERQYLINTTFSYPTNFIMSIGFILKSANPGRIKNYETDDFESLYSSVLSFNTYELVADIGSPYIYIAESSHAGNLNKLNVFFINGEDYIQFQSESYSPDVFHYFWLEIDPTGPPYSVNIYVDGKSNAVTFEGSIGAFTYVFASTCDYRINSPSLPTSYNETYHSGTINNILVVDGLVTNVEETIQQIINDGFSSVLDDGQILDYGFLYNDIQTTKINSALPVRNSLYLGTNSGDLLEGNQSIWESKINFSNINDIDKVTLGPNSKNSAGNTPAVSVGSLELSEGSIIKL